MEVYRQLLIEKINSLKDSKSPFAQSRLIILLKLLGELESEEK